ncbi:MAG: hypothetical protein KDC12_06340 [Flavobacteriales bacterium]|nr:hypothetical protein [Flavobacteriales bacterium]
MPDKLQHSINEHRKDLPMEDPLPGHMSRFETRLLANQSKKKRNVIPMWAYAVAAACVCIGILSITWFQLKADQHQFASHRQMSEVSPEMNRMESWFVKAIAERKGSLDMNDPSIAQGMRQLERLEQEYQILSEKLASNFGNEKILDAMIKNYRLRLEILENIQKHIEYKNKIKTKQNAKQVHNI